MIERFGGAGIPKEKISLVKDTYTFNFPGTSADFVSEFRNYYGPTMNAFDAAAKNGRADELLARHGFGLNSCWRSTTERREPRESRSTCHVEVLHALESKSGARHELGHRAIEPASP